MHALLLTWVLLAQSAPIVQADQVGQAYFLYIQGRQLDDTDDLPGAAAKYRQALEILPNAAELRAELAGVYAQQGEFDQAQAEAERALKIDTGNRSAHRVLGLVQASNAQRATPEVVRKGLLTSAAGHLEKVLGDGARDPLVQLTLGDLYVQLENYPKGIEALKEFLLDRPGYPQAVMLLVQAYRASGRAAEATALIEELRGPDTASAGARVQAVEQLERRGAWQEAADGWVELLAQDPENVEYRLRYATALVNGGELEGGRSVLLDLTRDRPNEASAWYLLAQVEEQAGRLEAAEQAAQRITEIDRADPRGVLALANVRTARGDFRGAVAALEPRVAAATDADVVSGAYAEMTRTLSGALIEIGQGKRAVQMLETARQRAPKDRRVQFALASTYDHTGQFDRAERAFRALLTEDPGYAPALNYLGYMLAEHGRKLDEAVSLIQRALAIDAGNPSYLDSLGWAYFKQQKFDLATDPLEHAAAAVPESSVIQGHLGELYLRTKRYGDAVTAFDRALAGDRDGLDVADATRKRDRARALSGRH
jgi:tetratricopeptide (TPR) repeat protein